VDAVNVLHVIAGLAPRYGGPAAVVSEMARAVADRGHHVEIMTTDIDGAGHLPVPVGRPLEWRGVTTTFFHAGRPKLYKFSYGLGRALRHRIREFDVVHIHSLYLFHTLAAAHYCRRYLVPYVLRPHGTLDPWHRSQHRWRKAVYGRLVEGRNLRGLAGIHYTTVEERDHAACLSLSAPSFVIPLGVDAQALTRPVDPTTLVVPTELAGRALVTFLGRLTAKKRLGLLLEAFAEVAHKRADAHLVIAGPDDEGIGRALRSQIVAAGLEHRVTMLGLVVGEAKVALLQRSQVFILPSQDENFGVAVVEALAAGLPVVITEGVAISRQLAEADAGEVVAATPSALSGAITHLIEDKELATSRADHGRALVQSAFSWTEIAARLEQMYQQVISTPTRRA
jgi:glycosyltransferase involved in cell wall biosynthesis